MVGDIVPMKECIGPGSRNLKRCLTAVALLVVIPIQPARAQTSEIKALVDLVRQQSQEIQDLKKRLAAVEANQAPQMATTPSPGAPAAAAPTIVAMTSPAETVPGMGAAPVLKAVGGVVTFHPRGRILIDFSATDGSNLPSRNYDATGPRAIRIAAGGTIGDHFAYLMEADLSQATATVLNAYVAWRLDNKAKVRIESRTGNLFANRGVEGPTAVDAVPFMQRNLVADAILPKAGFYIWPSI